MTEFTTISVTQKDKKRLIKFSKESGLSQKDYMTKLLDALQETGQTNPTHFEGVNSQKELLDLGKNIEGLKKMIRAIERDNLKPLFQEMYHTSTDLKTKTNDLSEFKNKVDRLESKFSKIIDNVNKILNIRNGEIEKLTQLHQVEQVRLQKQKEDLKPIENSLKLIAQHLDPGNKKGLFDQVISKFS